MSWIEGTIVTALIALLGLLAFAIIEDSQRWDDFKNVHHCKITQKMRGDTTTTVAPIIGGNGGIAVGVSSTPDKTAWLCDDGITYWR